MEEQKVIFVYNADSNFVSALFGFAHKLVSPSGYQCHLCTLTHGDFFVKREWKSFIDTLPVKTVFLYKDQFLKQYNVEVPLPAIFLQSQDGIREIISQAELDSFQSLHALKNSVIQKVERYVKRNYSGL